MEFVVFFSGQDCALNFMGRNSHTSEEPENGNWFRGPSALIERMRRLKREKFHKNMNTISLTLERNSSGLRRFSRSLITSPSCVCALLLIRKLLFGRNIINYRRLLESACCEISFSCTGNHVAHAAAAITLHLNAHNKLEVINVHFHAKSKHFT